MRGEDVNFFLTTIGALDKLGAVVEKLAQLLADQTYQIAQLKERVRVLEGK